MTRDTAQKPQQGPKQGAERALTSEVDLRHTCVRCGAPGAIISHRGVRCDRHMSPGERRCLAMISVPCPEPDPPLYVTTTVTERISLTPAGEQVADRILAGRDGR